MAYIKKKDRAIMAIEEEISKNGSAYTYKGMQGIKWDKWPICVKDVCVDNIVLTIDNITGEKKIYGCNIYDGDETTNERVVNDLSQKYVESILDSMTNSSKKPKNK